jgi:hypothetical protein
VLEDIADGSLEALKVVVNQSVLVKVILTKQTNKCKVSTIGVRTNKRKKKDSLVHFSEIQHHPIVQFDNRLRVFIISETFPLFFCSGI